MFGPGLSNKEIEEIAAKVIEKKKSREKSNNINPFSEYTLKIKRNLISLAAFGVVVKLIGLDRGSLNIFGVQSRQIDPELLHAIIFVSILYFLISFLWWSRDEIRDWDVNALKNLTEESNKNLSAYKKLFSEWNEKFIENKNEFTPQTLKGINDILLAISYQIDENSKIVKSLSISAKCRVYGLVVLFPISIVVIYVSVSWDLILPGVVKIISLFVN